MRLSYRGASYELPHNSVESTEIGTIGQYRGAPLRFSSSTGVPLPQSTLRLTYRGATYLGFR